MYGPQQFGLDWVEYIAISVVIVVTFALSLYFYRVNKKHEEVFWSNGSSPFLAILFSLIASSTSGVALLGKPAEAYQHGVDFAVFTTVTLIGTEILCRQFFLPVLHLLDTKSLYEYFDLRFDSRVRRLATYVYLMTKICYTALAIHPPAMVIHQFSGISFNTIAISLLMITCLTTAVGGLKGVIWTDALQGVIMIVTVGLMCSVSVYHVGGFDELFKIAHESGRMNLSDLSLDPAKRVSLWTYGLLLPGICTLCLNQGFYQRFKSLSSEKAMKIGFCLQVCGLIFFANGAVLLGLSIYAYYYGCDPKSANIVANYSNVIIYWVGDIGRSIKGLTGVYIAGIACASISTIATNFNSIAGLVYNDLFKKYVANPQLDGHYVRLTTLGLGVLVTAMSILIKDSGSLVELSFALNGSGDALIAGLFILGMIIVPANKTGAFWGGLINLIVTISIVIGSRIYYAQGIIPQYHSKLMRTDLCEFNVSTTAQPLISSKDYTGYVFPLFKMSPMSVPLFSCATTILLGTIISCFFPGRPAASAPVNANLFAPFARRFLPQEIKRRYKVVPLMITTECEKDNCKEAA